MGDEHPIDQQLDDPPTAGESERVQARTKTRTQDIDIGAEFREAEVLLVLRAQISLLLHQRLDAVLPYSAARVELVEGDDLSRERIYQPLDLALGTATCLLEVLEAGISILLHELPRTGPTEGLGDDRGGAEPLAYIGPDPQIEPIHPDSADTAMLPASGIDAREVAIAEVIGLGASRLSRCGQPAHGTTDPGPQSIVAPDVVATRLGLAEGPQGLHPGETLAGDHGRHIHGNPFVAGPAARMMVLALCRRAPSTPAYGLHRVIAMAIGRAGIDLVAQHAFRRRRMPVGAAVAGRTVQVSQAGCDRMHAEAVLCVPGKHLADDARFRLLDAQARRIAGMCRITPVTIGGIDPGQELPGPQFDQSAAARAIGNQRPFILDHRAPNLEQQLVIGILADRVLQNDHGTPQLRQFLQEEHVMDKAPRQPIRGRHQDSLELPTLGGITQAIQGWTVDAGTAVALIPVYLACLERPALHLGPGLEAFDLVRHGLILSQSLG
jgi:hypothetical protein